jgi:hypothetical protein
MGVEKGDYREVRVVGICKPHLNEDTMEKARQMKDDFVVKSVVITISLSGFGDLADAG